jgi:ATP-dependent RNA helicase DDX1
MRVLLLPCGGSPSPLIIIVCAMSGGFADLGLLTELLQAIDDQGWSLPTDIQDEAIPLILGGGDVMGAAETGSGKTAAFALPVLQVVYERLQSTLGKRTRVDPATTSMKLNDLDRDPEITLSPSGLQCSYAGTDKWLGVRATHGIKTGKFYYEVIVQGTGNCRVGWSSRLAHLDLGKDKLGFGYGAKGFKSYEGVYEKYGETYTSGDIVGCMLDLDSGAVQFSKNGKVFENAYRISRDVLGAVYFPTISLSGSTAEINLGQNPLRHQPAGYRSFYTANSEDIFHADSDEAYTIQNKRKPLAIILEPTRDLAEQVYQCFVDLSKYITSPPIRCALMIGDDGRSNASNKKMLEEGVDIVIGTLGKLTAGLESKALDLSHIRFFILDEADRMTSADNLSGVKKIFTACPTSGTGVHRLQVCFFSATLHDPAIKELAGLICQHPTWIDLKGVDASLLPSTLHHAIYPIHCTNETYNHWVKGSKNNFVDQVHIESDFHSNHESNKNLSSQRIKEMKPFILKSIIDKYKVSKVYDLYLYL